MSSDGRRNSSVKFPVRRPSPQVRI